MRYPMHTLVNDFAIRSFRETADKDYIAARMAYRARLIQPFLWSALHCLEKCSADTALRDINELLAAGALRKSAAGGRSTSYELNDVEK